MNIMLDPKHSIDSLFSNRNIYLKFLNKISKNMGLTLFLNYPPSINFCPLQGIVIMLSLHSYSIESL